MSSPRGQTLQRWLPGPAAKATIATAFVVSALLQIFGVPFTSGFGTQTRFDMDVYRIGGQIWHQGLSLYAEGSMPFTTDGICCRSPIHRSLRCCSRRSASSR